MQIISRFLRLGVIATMNVLLTSGCMLPDENAIKPGVAGLIATPPSHYSTQKARYLGQKYRMQLDRFVENITANPKTAKLQFANNVASPGGIGFFTHSAVGSPDERFLEVVVGSQESFTKQSDHSVKVARLFSLYGKELLAILSSDPEMYNDKALSGYGLNFTWQTVGARAVTERIVLYFAKGDVGAFLTRELSQERLLAGATIFVIEPAGQANLVSFRSQELTADVRAPIHEQVLLPELAKADQSLKSAPAESQTTSELSSASWRNGRGERPSEKIGNTTTLQSRSNSNVKNPEQSASMLEQMISEQEIGSAITEIPHAIDSNPKDSRPSRWDRSPTAAKAPTKTEARSGARMSLDPTNETKAQGVLQPESKGRDESNSKPIAEPPRERTDMNLSPAAASSKVRLMGVESLASEDVKLNLTTPKAVSTSSDEALPAPSLGLKSAETPGEGVPQQLALVRNRGIESVPQNQSAARPFSTALEGFIIQLGFTDRSEAQRWGDIFHSQGYVVSITESGTTGSLRLRIGNFRMRDDAERQLVKIQNDGVTGIILNLPQAYRPQIHSSVP